MTQAIAIDPRNQPRVDWLVRKARRLDAKLGEILHEIYQLTDHPALTEAEDFRAMKAELDNDTSQPH